MMRFMTKKRERIAISWVVCITMVFASFAGPFTQLEAQATTTVPPVPPITVDKQVVGADWVDKDLGIAKVRLTVNSQDIETTITTPLTTRIVLVLDYSGSMQGTKINTLRQVAKDFIDSTLQLDGVEIAIVLFGSSIKDSLDFTDDADALKDIIDDNNASGATLTQAGIRDAQAMLDDVTADNEFMIVLSDGEPTYSYKATAARAVTQADRDLNYNDGAGGWPFVLTSFSNEIVGSGGDYSLITYGYNGNVVYDDRYWVDGFRVTNNGFATVSEALLAKQNPATTIYSVGFGFSAGSTGDKVMEAVASSADKNFLAGVSNLDVVFATIQSEIIEQAAGKGAVVSDPMGLNSDVAGKQNYKYKAVIDAAHPVVMTNPDGSSSFTGTTGSLVSADITSSYEYTTSIVETTPDDFEWVLTTGNIKEGTYTLTYYIQIQGVNSDGVGDLADVAPTNNGAVLTYTDAEDEQIVHTIPFVDPSLRVEHYTTEYYFNGVKDSSKTTIQSAIAGRTPVTVVAPSFTSEGYNYVKTVYGNNNANTALSIVQDGANNIIKIYYVDKTGSLTVSKQVLKNNVAFNVRDTFYFGLFSGSDGTGLIGTAKDVTLEDKSTGSVEFTGLTLGTTYYVFETNSSGAPITDTVGGFVHGGNYILDGQGTSFKPTREDYTGEITIKNNVVVGTDVQFVGTKNLTGRHLAVGDQFNFAIFEGSSTTPIAAGHSDDIVANTSENSVAITFEKILYGINDVGRHTYTVKEIGVGSSGITFDTNEYTVYVDVSINAAGVLSAVADYPDDTTKLTFTNMYHPNPVSWTPTATKALDGKKLADYDAGTFEFTLTQTQPASSADSLTATNAQNGAVTFAEIQYTEADTYVYTLEEVEGTVPGVDYDNNKITVTVIVEDDGKGNLVIPEENITYSSDPTFTNTYTADPVSWSPSATKVLEGKALADYDAGTFEFTLTQTQPASSADPLTATNAQNGAVTFAEIQYTEADTYVYTLEEVEGTVPGVDYDKNKITVTVIVEDDGKGNLVIPEENITYSSDPTFTNTYTADPVSWTPDVSKNLAGRSLNDYEDGTFSFIISPVENNNVRIANINEPVGNVGSSIPFKSIEFTEPGTYTYNISEVLGSVPGITYDKNTIVVTVVVEDDGKGNLVIPEENITYSGGQVFNNSYEGPGSITVTKKVVVITDDPEITVNYMFYAALFEDQDGTMVKVSDVKELQVVNSASATAVFDKLDLDKTYFIFETDAEGNIILTEEDGTIIDPIIPDWTTISYSNSKVTLTPNMIEGESSITNVFDPEDFPLLGSITVNKKVTVNGKPFASNRTFYVGLFADKELTELVSEIKPLKMNGNSSTTTEFLTDIDGNPLEAGATYYIAETDKSGEPLIGTIEQLGFEIAIDNAKIVITEEGNNINIINKFKTEEFPLTGDNSNMSLWLFLAMLGVAGAIAPIAFRKKEEAND